MARSSNGSARPKRRGLTGRSGREWAVRGVLALGALMVGYVSTSATLANVLLRIDPSAAYLLAPRDGRIAAASAEQKFKVSLDSSGNSDSARLARRALRRDPTAVRALNVLGLQAQLREEEGLADRLFGYSFSLSRRELRAQMWAIEQAVERGDIGGALTNYDIALRTSPSARETLFPILSSAISESAIRRPLIDILSTKPVWGAVFIRYVSIQSPDPLAVAQLFEAANGRGLPIQDSDRARVVNGLVAQNLMEEAWSYYETFRPNAVRTRSRDPGFGLGNQAPSSFDWMVGNAPGLSVAFLGREDDGFLDFAVPPSTRAVVVSQTQLLPSGDYRIEGRSRGIDQPERSQPYWTLACRGGAELGRVDVPNSSEMNGAFSGKFTVPSSCPVQTLSLVLRSSDNVAGVSGQIDYVQLAPVKD